MRITRLNSIHATLLIRLYKICTRPYVDYACTALTALCKTEKQKLEVIQRRCLWYAARPVDSTSISNNELPSRCNIVSAEQRILALAGSLWKKGSKNNDYIINSTNQMTKQKHLWISLKVIGSSNSCTLLHIFYNFVATSSTIFQNQILRQHFLLPPVFLLN